MKHMFVLVALFALCGCAEKWTKPGASPGEFEATKAACVGQAAAQYPPSLQQQQQGSYMDTLMGTQGSMCSGSGPYVSCTPTIVGPLPTTVEVDVNQNARNQAARDCLIQHGWSS